MHRISSRNPLAGLGATPDQSPRGVYTGDPGPASIGAEPRGGDFDAGGGGPGGGPGPGPGPGDGGGRRQRSDYLDRVGALVPIDPVARTGDTVDNDPAGGGGVAPQGGDEGSGTDPFTAIPNFRYRFGNKARGRASSLPNDPNPSPLPPGRVRSPATYLAPRARLIPAYFSIARVNAPVIRPNQAAWYGLRRVRVGIDSGELLVRGVTGYTYSPDYTGEANDDSATFGVSSLPWGGIRGIKACVIVGRNLPITVGAWTSATVHAAGIGLCTSAANGDPNARNNLPTVAEYFARLRFPPGRWYDVNNDATTAVVLPHVKPFMGAGARVRNGETLDVALVLDRATINGQNGQIVGLAELDVICDEIDQGPGFYQ
jgi:hypothetical protein